MERNILIVLRKGFSMNSAQVFVPVNDGQRLRTSNPEDEARSFEAIVTALAELEAPLNAAAEGGGQEHGRFARFPGTIRTETLTKNPLPFLPRHQDDRTRSN